MQYKTTNRSNRLKQQVRKESKTRSATASTKNGKEKQSNEKKMKINESN